MVAAGEGTSFLLKANGTVWGWGDQRDGRLGDGQDRDNSRTQPRPVIGLSGIRQIAVGAAPRARPRADGAAPRGRQR
jgi:alpha-tubulin suppressor-like RCC1 family protein